jgi:hypothetical protein
MKCVRIARHPVVVMRWFGEEGAGCQRGECSGEDLLGNTRATEDGHG